METSPKQTLRCLHFLPEIKLDAGGVVRAVIDTVEGLRSAGVRVTLLTHDPADCPEDWRHGNSVRIIKIDRPQWRGLCTPKALRQEIEAVIADQDIVHLHTPWAVFNRTLAQAAARLGKPYIVTVHGMLDDWCMTQRGLKKRLYLNLNGRKMLENAAFVHCTAEGEMQQSAKWYPAGNPRVIPLIVDLDPYNPAPTPDEALAEFDYLNNDGIKLLFLSRVHPKKGLEHLLRACGELNELGVRFQLGIAGPGDEPYVRDLKDMAEAMGIADRTHFLGMVKGKLKLSLYAASDVFVLPTSQENFGLVFPESLLCGTPVITTKGVDIWPELQEAGAVICGQDKSEISEAIRRFVEMGGAERAELGERGRLYVLDWLDPSKIIERYQSEYQSAVSAGR